MPSPTTLTAVERRRRLGELSLLFLKLGTIAFGGPAAHIAMMDEEVVRKRGWLTREEFLDLLGATNLIPGPNSTELAIHLGSRRAGFLGLLVAGTSFILPASAITLGIAWFYVRFGSLPQAAALLYGIKPVMIAVVLQALWGFARTAVKTKLLAAIAVLAVAASALGLHELWVLAAAGALTVGARLSSQPKAGGVGGAAALLSPTASLLGATGAGAIASAAIPVSLSGLFLAFVKIGSVLFGSGYVLLAFLRADLVDRWHWLTEAQLLDAVAVGQITPGPVFTSATFIGYLLAGEEGALLATVGIFLPAFFFVALSGPLVPRLRRSRIAGAFLDGVNVASLALMVTVTWHLARSAVVDAVTGIIGAVAAAVLIRFRPSSLWLIAAGALIGIAKFWLG